MTKQHLQLCYNTRCWSIWQRNSFSLYTKKRWILFDPLSHPRRPEILGSLSTARVLNQFPKFALLFPGSHFKDRSETYTSAKNMHSCLPGKKMPSCNKTVEKRVNEERREEYFEKVRWTWMEMLIITWSASVSVIHLSSDKVTSHWS